MEVIRQVWCGDIGMLIVRTGDITWLIFLLVYGVDGCLTIVHRILLHEEYLSESFVNLAFDIFAIPVRVSIGDSHSVHQGMDRGRRSRPWLVNGRDLPRSGVRDSTAGAYCQRPIP